MKNIVNNNCSNNTNNNQINNNKSEVKTMKQLNVNTINKVINSENNSVIASTIGFAGIGNDGFLFNTINNIEQINAMQPERIRLSDDQIDAYIANAKLEG